MSSDHVDDPDDVQPDQRIADPDNYNLRRRLQQIHDAREFVKEVKNRNLGKELSNPRKDTSGRNRAVAEAVTDYATELLPVLSRQGERELFRDEDIGDQELTVGDFIDDRGAPDGNPLAYTVSMKVWTICNRHFEDVAGPQFEDAGLPREKGFDATGEAEQEDK